ncbi:MAG: hypothetical protein COV10_02765 [Candidatus Vogelbacteria bacterium CG10_big_fil_rev_8_21_14_0_10_51_16]|uniref:Uncharacterized protein n=1 Tax=Candidatus Vogelbacteria bacterium CG10_big_fil_rev_8_21_14_0_10_51_16 TaxID=1975045 RepID=A0A2H0RDZ8_9BACT|nr:MAG: hypothetical protein COV10_02765 [Candidatus Vogelbacteria bacterium CG10_big_fil_rev_8_21_14_0_10_51_16]
MLHYLTNKERVGVDLLIVLALLFTPWWFFVTTLALVSLFSSNFIELFVFALIYDLVYYASEVRLLGIPFTFVIGAFIFYAMLQLIGSFTSILER